MPRNQDLYGVEPNVQGGGDATSLQGTPISTTPPTTGQVLEFDGTQYVPTTGAIPPSTANANTFYGGPTTGSPATPAFRALVPSDVPVAIPAVNIGAGAVDNTEFGYLDGVTSAIQGQIDGKQPLDADLTALAALSTTGLTTRTATNTFTTRSLVAGVGNTVNNGDGVAGNLSVDVTYGTTAGTAAQGNDSRFAGIPALPLSKANGGFGQSVATGLTNDQVAIVAGTAITIGALTTAAVPNLPASKITSGQIAEANGGLGSDTSALSAGLLTKTATNTYATRSLTAPAAGITITNPAGTAGSPTFALANDLAAVEGLAGTGLAVRTATDTWTNRSVVAGTGSTVTNGDGVSGNPAVNVTYGTASNTATQGNDSRLPPTPTAAGKILYDTGSAYAESAAGTSGQVLVSGGAGAPTWGSAGGAGPTFSLNTAGSWATNGYLGVADDGSSTVNVNVVPWIAPCAGTLKNLRVFGFQTPSGPTPITIYKATVAASPSYSATALTCTVAGGANTANDTTHSVSVSAGDLIVAFCSAFWATNGCCVTTQFIPT